MWFAFSTDLLKGLLGRPIVEHKKKKFQSQIPLDTKWSDGYLINFDSWNYTWKHTQRRDDRSQTRIGQKFEWVLAYLKNTAIKVNRD